MRDRYNSLNKQILNIKNNDTVKYFYIWQDFF